MMIHDTLYGDEEITSKLLIDLINAPSIQRLKGIAQFGLSDRYYLKEGFSRYDHSVGVMILLKRLSASEEEQVAGLLHDVSHTAFSHVVDWVVGSGGREDFQDNHHEEFIDASELPMILKAHGLDPKRVADHHHYTLLEQDAPDLCADRVDYALREWKGPERECFSDLVARNGKMVFDNQASALVFGRLYAELERTRWGKEDTRWRHQILAHAIMRAIELELIEFDDFWKDDEYILQRMEASDDAVIQMCLSILLQQDLSNLPITNEVVPHKFRYVDPPYIREDGSLGRLSEDVPEYKELMEEARRSSTKGNRGVDIDACLQIK